MFTLAIVLGYIVVGAAVSAAVTNRLCEGDWSEGEYISIAAGLIWPVTIAVLMGYYPVKYLGLGMASLIPVKHAPKELPSSEQMLELGTSHEESIKQFDNQLLQTSTKGRKL